MSIQYKNSFQSTLGMVLATSYTGKCFFSSDASTLMILAQDGLNYVLYPFVSSDNWVTYTERPIIPITNSSSNGDMTANGNIFVWTIPTQPYVVETNNGWITSSQTPLLPGPFVNVRVPVISSDGLTAAFVDSGTSTLYVATRASTAVAFSLAQSVVQAGVNYGNTVAISANGSVIFVGDNGFAPNGRFYIYQTTTNWTTPPSVNTVDAPPVPGLVSFPNVILDVNSDGSSCFGAITISGVGTAVYVYTTDNWSTHNINYLTSPSGFTFIGGALQPDSLYALPSISALPFGTPPAFAQYVTSIDNWATNQVLQTLDNNTIPEIFSNFLPVCIGSISSDQTTAVLLDVNNNLIYIFNTFPSPPVPPNPPVPLLLSADRGINAGPPKDATYTFVDVRRTIKPPKDEHYNALHVGKNMSFGIIPKDNAWSHLTFNNFSEG